MSVHSDLRDCCLQSDRSSFVHRTTSNFRPSRSMQNYPASVITALSQDGWKKTVNVGILCVGFETEGGRAVMRDVHHEPGFKPITTVIDVDQSLKTCLANHPLSPHLDGMNGETQRAVFAQTRFAETVLAAIDDILQQFGRSEFVQGDGVGLTRVVVVTCKSGIARSDVFARCLTSVLNALVDNRGFRIFNAKFSSVAESSRLDAHDVMQFIIDHRTSSSVTLETWSDFTQPKTMYGYGGAVSSSAAMSAWLRIYDGLCMVVGWNATQGGVRRV